MTDKKQKLEAAEKWKDVAAKTWLLMSIGCFVIGFYGWLTNQMYFLGMSFATFMIGSIAVGALFSNYEYEAEELEEEIRVDEIEERIERLEAELDG